MISQTQDSQHLVANELQKFLDSSRLSLSGLAKRLNVSKAQLSLIKNSKKAPSLDLGLKILKYTGTGQDLRKQWALGHLAQHSDEYEELENSVREELQKLKHTQSLCDRFEYNLTLMNIYLDVVNSEKGITNYSIEKNYGKESLTLVEALNNAGLIEQKKDVLVAANSRSVLTKRSSFNFMKTIFDDQRDKFDSGNWDGRFQFIMDDVDLEGQEKLQKLLQQTMKEAGEILKAHERPRSQGGKRMIFQVLSGMVKGPMLGLVFISLFSLNGFAGGVEGGGSSPMGGVEGGGSSIMKMRLVGDQGREQLEEQVKNLYDKTESADWNDLKEKAYSACREKYRMTSKNKLSLKVRTVSYDRLWIERREHHEALTEITVSCSPNRLMPNIK